MANGDTANVGGISPAVRAAMLQGFGLPGQGATPTGAGTLPPSSGATPPFVQTNPFDLSSIVSQISSLPQYAGPSAQLEKIGGQESQIADALRQTGIPASQGGTMPQMGFQPHLQKPTGGISFLKDLGQILATVGMGTRLGQGISGAVYGPGIRRWQAERQSLADKLSALKGEEEIPKEELQATTGLAQAGGLAAYRGGMLQTREQMIDVQRQRAENQLRLGLGRLDVSDRTLAEKTKEDQIRNQIQTQANQIREQAVQAGLSRDEADNAVKLSLGNVSAEARTQGNFKFSTMIDNFLGTSFAPPAPQAPAGATPVAGGPPAKLTPKGQTIYARDPQGKLHQAPGGTKLPQGWTPEKR